MQMKQTIANTCFSFILAFTLKVDRETIEIEKLKRTIKIKSPGQNAGTFLVPTITDDI